MTENKITQLLDQGRKALQSGDLVGAQAIAEKAISLAPQDSGANLLQGLVYSEQGNYERAIPQLEKTLFLDNSKGLANKILGYIFQLRNQPDQMLFHYQEAISKGINEPDIYIVVANILKSKGQIDEGLEYIQEALTIDPENTKTLSQLAIYQFQTGNKKATIDTISKLLSINPEFYSAYSLLTRARKFTEHDSLTKQMQELFAQETLSSEGRMYLGFALGKVYEDLGEYDKSFESLSIANKIKRSTIDYSTERNNQSVTQTIAKFSKSFVQQHTGGGYHDKTPIFVVGMPRSGTSLIEQILASHPAVFGAGELNELQNAITLHEGSSLTSDKFFRIGKQYAKNIRNLSSSATYIVDKLPGNFTRIPYILLSLPEAKIIHCTREPLDICFSNYKNLYMGDILPMSYNLVEMGAGYLAYQRLMAHWHSLFPGKIFDINYEELISHQRRETEKLLAYCGLEWNDNCLNFHKTDRAVQTNSSMQVKQALYNNSVNLWENYSRHLGPLKLALAGKTAMNVNEEVINLNGKSYKIADLPEAAATQLQNIRAAEDELKRLQRQAAITNTARNTYLQAFEAAVSSANNK